MSKKTRIVVSSVLLLMTILVLSRCDYSAKVITSAEPPDTVFNSFIAAMKEKNFSKADTYLANGATINPQNETGYSFFDDYVDTVLDLLECESVGEPEYDGTTASLKVNLISIDSNDFLSWSTQNLARLEHDYMVKKNLKEFDNSDRKAVDKVMSMALKEYVKKDVKVSREVDVNFIFTDKSWKINGNEDLIKAIYGGNDNEGKDKSDKTESVGD